MADTPDLFLRLRDRRRYMICRAVDSPACKILFDMYHTQRNEGHIIRNIDLTWNEIAYFQIGDNPGRKEPGTGEINYKNIFKHIHGKMQADKRDFIFGMEHGNALPGRRRRAGRHRRLRRRGCVLRFVPAAAASLAGLAIARDRRGADSGAASPAGRRPSAPTCRRPGASTTWTLDGTGAWTIRDGLLLLEKAGVPAGPIRRPGALAILKTPAARRRVDRRRAAVGRTRGRHPRRHPARRRLAVADTALLRPPVGGARRRPQRHLHRRQRRPPTHRRQQRPSRPDGPRLAYGSAGPNASTGRLEVFVDGETAPIMTATDRTSRPDGWGSGSFDDPGAFRRIRVQGTPRPLAPVVPGDRTRRARPFFRYTTGYYRVAPA